MEIAKKEIEIILKEQREEYQRYVGALSESFESQVKLIAELAVKTQKQLIVIKEMVAKNTEDITLFKEMGAKNTENVEIIKMDIHIIKNDLKEKVTKDELMVLEKRVMFLEKKFQKA
ncbi:hypothetical protein KKH46_01210 [Patescibacteria group bacterium]|nr:hypothetical protein [Patescibacteria group bacterium]MBU1956500.1 hypothetical protein [Patescibacteria group bacterium]